MVHAPSWEAQDGGAVHAAGHLRAALSDLLEVRRGAADHGGAAVRASRRHLAALPAQLGRRAPGGPVLDHVGTGTGSEVMQGIVAPMVGGPPRQNSCRLHRSTPGAAMKDELGSIRMSAPIQI